MAKAHHLAEAQAAAQGRLTRSAALVALATLASRVLGLARDTVIAAAFGKRSTDVFFVAFTIPNVLRRLLAEGSLTAAFIPVLCDWRRERGEAGARSVLSHTLGPASALLALVCAIGMVAAPWLVRLFAYGLVREPGRLELAINLTRLMFPFLMTVGLVALAMGALNVYDHFLSPALAPIALNVGIITLAVLAPAGLARSGFDPVYAIALGVLVGGAMQVLVQMPALARRDLLVRPRLDLQHAGMRRIGVLMLPSLAGLAIYELNVILSRQFASFLHEGAISCLYYAQRFIEFPIGIVATAMATVTMPELSTRAGRGQRDELRETYRFALRLVLFVMLPATAGLIALAHPLISVLFLRGAFTRAMAQETAFTLAAFSLGLCGAGGVRQTAPVFYAMQDTRSPVKVAAIALVVYALSAGLTYRRLGTPGLALSVSLAASVNFLLLIALLRRRLGHLGLRQVAASLARAGFSACLCGLAARWVARLGRWELPAAFVWNLGILLLASLAGALTFFISTLLLRSPEPGEVWCALRRGKALSG